jgi:hypothetical protein
VAKAAPGARPLPSHVPHHAHSKARRKDAVGGGATASKGMSARSPDGAKSGSIESCGAAKAPKRSSPHLRFPETTWPGTDSSRHPPGPCSRCAQQDFRKKPLCARDDYCFGASEALLSAEVEVAAADMAVSAEEVLDSAEAAGAALSLVVAGGGVVSVLAASCFAQAVSISAATSAPRASLVFIDRYLPK